MADARLFVPVNILMFEPHQPVAHRLQLLAQRADQLHGLGGIACIAVSGLCQAQAAVEAPFAHTRKRSLRAT